jgi:DNA-binding NtrC family response regulator
VSLESRNSPVHPLEALDRPATEWRLVSRSPAMAELLAGMERLADWHGPVLITGESGAGKEVAARRLHRLGPGRKGPLLKLGCSHLLAEEVTEGEAWAGAGEVLLDEIGDLPAGSQACLDRALESGRLASPGRPRLVALTHRDLESLAGDGRFHAGLASRLAAAVLRVPPLRQRREDLPVLVERLLGDLSRRKGLPEARLSRAALRAIHAHPWPGNVRELLNALSFALMLRPAGGVIGPEHLPPHLGPGKGPSTAG